MECMGLTSVAWRQPVSACPTDGFKTVYVLRKGCLSVSWALLSIRVLGPPREVSVIVPCGFPAKVIPMFVSSRS